MSYQERDATEPDPDAGERLSRAQIRLLIGVAVVSVIIAVVVVIIVAGSSGTSHDTSASAAGGSDSGTATVTGPASAAHTASTGIGASSTGSATTSASVTTSPASGGAVTPAGGPVPKGLDFGTFTAISDTTWWLMGTAPCGSPPCTSIVRTTDGGKSFVGIPAPRTGAVTELRFADSRDGYAYGSQLWSTHNGGATWTHVPVSGQIEDLSIAGGYVYFSGARGIERSSVSSDDFSVIHTGVGYGVWGQGSNLYAAVANASGGGQVLVTSGDSGTSFTAHPAPAGTVACGNVESQADGVVWAACATGTEGGLWRSVDDGAHWSTLDPAAGSGEGEPNSAAFAEATASTAVYGSTALYRTTNGGSNWSTVPGFGASDTSVAYLGFTDATHGVAIVLDQSGEASSRLEVTTDGGASYHAVTVSSG